jgi:hypothetical protein
MQNDGCGRLLFCALRAATCGSATMTERVMTMSDLVRFESKRGVTVLVEAADPVTGRVVRGGGRPAAVISEAGESLEQVVGKIGPVIQGVVTQLREGADWPEQVEVEFAVKISADSSVIIARAGGEANFRVCMRWSKGLSS